MTNGGRNMSWRDELRRNLATQDNRCTAHPMFVVQQRRRIYGMDPDYAQPEDAVAWLHCDGDEESGDEAAALEAAYQATGDVPEDYTRTAYLDIWVFVTACFTEQGCKDYLGLNGHNLTAPRIYVESAHRNEEWQRVRALLSEGNE